MDHIDPKGSKQRNCPKQLQTHNLPTDDEKNINSKNKERSLLLTSCGLFPEEQKGHHKESRDNVVLLYIDQHILNESKTRRKKLGMTWFDYKKVYDMVPQSWIINCHKIYKISYEFIKFIEKTMKT